MLSMTSRAAATWRTPSCSLSSRWSCASSSSPGASSSLRLWWAATCCGGPFSTCTRVCTPRQRASPPRAWPRTRSSTCAGGLPSSWRPCLPPHIACSGCCTANWPHRATRTLCASGSCCSRSYDGQMSARSASPASAAQPLVPLPPGLALPRRRPPLPAAAATVAGAAVAAETAAAVRRSSSRPLAAMRRLFPIPESGGDPALIICLHDAYEQCAGELAAGLRSA
mmetsp:Transcript_9352/g.29170  ORF Transcript_9352/g.29170 Transcript_9352/m.29170 type:complete len:225 (+) Transcript_9352:4102-4776(+)